MKSIIFVVLLVALAYSSPLNTYVEDEMVKFDFDVYQDSPISFLVKGEIDPRNENNRKIQTFLKLAGQYIPVLEQMADAENDLTWRQTWHIGVLGFNIDVTAFVQLIVGWRVTPGGYTTDVFNVVYTPFAFGGTYAQVNGTSFPAIGSSEVGLRFVNASAPISFSLYRAGKVCFRGSYIIQPVHLRQHLYSALNSCQDEILNDIIEGPFIFNWQCNYTNPVNITIWDYNFTSPLIGDFVGETCIGV